MELGRSADGAHMAQTRAGSSTGSVQNAAGLLDNAKCHIYHEDATVAKTKATGPGSGEDDSLTLILSLIVHSVSLFTKCVLCVCDYRHVNARRYGQDPDLEQQWKVSPTKRPVLYRNGSWPVVTAGQLFPVVPCT